MKTTEHLFTVVGIFCGERTERFAFTSRELAEATARLLQTRDFDEVLVEEHPSIPLLDAVPEPVVFCRVSLAADGTVNRWESSLVPGVDQLPVVEVWEGSEPGTFMVRGTDRDAVEAEFERLCASR